MVQNKEFITKSKIKIIDQNAKRASIFQPRIQIKEKKNIQHPVIRIETPFAKTQKVKLNISEATSVHDLDSSPGEDQPLKNKLSNASGSFRLSNQHSRNFQHLPMIHTNTSSFNSKSTPMK